MLYTAALTSVSRRRLFLFLWRVVFLPNNNKGTFAARIVLPDNLAVQGNGKTRPSYVHAATIRVKVHLMHLCNRTAESM
jgi:hypothetical protein